METLYDVQQLLKQFGVYVYVGKRIYDIELMQIELKNFYDSPLDRSGCISDCPANSYAGASN